MVTRPKNINNTDRKFPPDQEVLLIRRLVRYVYLHICLFTCKYTFATPK